MKCLCLIPTADLRVYTIHTTAIPVPATCREGSCSPNLPWPQNLSTQDCRQPTPAIGTRDEIPCFGQDSVNELDLLGETQQRLPFCFGSSRTSNAQAKFTWNRLLPGTGEQRQRGTDGSHQSPLLVQMPQTVLSTWHQCQCSPGCHYVVCALGLPLSCGNSDVCLLTWLLPTAAQASIVPATPHLPTFEAVSG